MNRNQLLIACSVAVLALSTTAALNTRAIGAVVAITTCATTTACTGGTNTSTGPGVGGTNSSTGFGVLGTGTNGTGVKGTTAHNSTGPANATYGVYGQDVSTAGSFDIGVKGLSTRGIGTSGQSTSNIGVRGISSTYFGLSGTSTSSVGTFGTSTSGVGVEGTSSTNIGVYGTSASSIAVYGSAPGYLGVYGNGGTYGVYGYGGTYGTYAYSAGGNGVRGVTSTGTGVYAQSNSGFGLEAHTGGRVGAYVTNSNGNGGDIAGTYVGVIARSDTFPFVATTSTGANLFYIDGSGNVFYHGGLTHFAPTRSGASVTAFTAQSTTAAMEDTGTARLTAGQATVMLDPTFAAAIDQHRVYQVFLTPGGDTRGLYVASKSPTQFVVREVQGGRGTFNFDYHIYATELGRANQRMALASPNAKALRLLPSPKILSPVKPKQ